MYFVTNNIYSFAILLSQVSPNKARRNKNKVPRAANKIAANNGAFYKNNSQHYYVNKEQSNLCVTRGNFGIVIKLGRAGIPLEF